MKSYGISSKGIPDLMTLAECKKKKNVVTSHLKCYLLSTAIRILHVNLNRSIVRQTYPQMSVTFLCAFRQEQHVVKQEGKHISLCIFWKVECTRHWKILVYALKNSSQSYKETNSTKIPRVESSIAKSRCSFDWGTYFSSGEEHDTHVFHREIPGLIHSQNATFFSVILEKGNQTELQ